MMFSFHYAFIVESFECLDRYLLSTVVIYLVALELAPPRSPKLPVFKTVISCLTFLSVSSDLFRQLYLSLLAVSCGFCLHFKIMCYKGLRGSFYSSIVFHCCTLFHWLKRIQFVYPFHCWWAIGFLPVSAKLLRTSLHGSFGGHDTWNINNGLQAEFTSSCFHSLSGSRKCSP